jgi:hypothetical protein
LLWAAFCAAPAAAAEPKTVRDFLWIWGHYEGSYNNEWGLPRNSPITPREGARSMGIQNLILVRYKDRPAPPYDSYAAQFRDLKKIMWSVTGAGGATSEQDRAATLALAAKMPNITGVFMDDFFHFTRPEELHGKEVPAALSVADLQKLRKRLTVGGRRLDLGVTLYVSQLDPRIVPHMQECDVVSLWTWEAANLARLEENMAKYQRLLPGKRTLLGLYMWDFSGPGGVGRPMPVESMKKQCELALKWLRQGRIEGMIFLATNICAMDLEAVNWSRRWIAEVGGRPLREAAHGDSGGKSRQ